MNVIVGHNACGKTYRLTRLYEECSGTKEFNLQRDPNKGYVLSQDKINVLNDMEELDFIDAGGIIGTLSFEKFSLATLRMLSLLTSDVDYLFLDEPELGFKESELSFIFRAISRLGTTFKDVWITSHSERAVWLQDAKFYTVDNGKDLVRVTKEEADEILFPMRG